jgi:hypothetical protein
MLNRLLSILFLLAIPAWGCTDFPRPIPVRRTFTLRVKSVGDLVSGLKVTIRRTASFPIQMPVNDEPPLTEYSQTFTTASDGSVLVNLPLAGTYSLEVDHDIFHDYEILEVGDSAKQDEVFINWPGVPVLVTNTARGAINSGLYTSKSAPLAGKSLVLYTFFGHKEIARTATGNDGSFTFPELPNGAYVMHLILRPKGKKHSEEESGDIAIVVDRIRLGSEQRKIPFWCMFQRRSSDSVQLLTL